MGYIYEAVDQAKGQIKAAYKDRVATYGPIWEIIDRRWNNQLHCPIHAAGYFLNPSIVRFLSFKQYDLRILFERITCTSIIATDKRHKEFSSGKP